MRREDIYTLDELAQRFSIDKLNKAPAVFDYKKLEWYNGQYIRMMSDDELAALCLPYAVKAGLFNGSRKEVLAETQRRKERGGEDKGEPTEQQLKIFTASMALVKERLIFLKEVPEKIAYLFKEPEIPAIEEFIPKKCDLTKTIELLQIGKELVSAMAKAASDEEAENFIKAEAEKREVKLGDLMMPLRVAITGSRVSPPLFGSLRILGADCSEQRVQRALDKLTNS